MSYVYRQRRKNAERRRGKKPSEFRDKLEANFRKWWKKRQKERKA